MWYYYESTRPYYTISRKQGRGPNMVCISGIPVRERLRQEVHHKAKASLSYTVRPRLKRKQTWKEASLLLWVP